MKALRMLAVIGILVAVLGPQTFASGRNPGSVLVYPVVRSGPTFFTMISVTNTNTSPQTPFSFGGSILAHYEYVNVDANDNDAFMPDQCIIFNRTEFLTPADHLSVVASCHNATVGDQEGYLVISAEDPSKAGSPPNQGVPVDFDYLVGSELVINASGGMYSINAIPFSSPLDRSKEKGMNGLVPTDEDDDDELDLDGIEYEGVPDVLIIDSFVALGGSQLALINLEGGIEAINTVQLLVWNDNEFSLSATRPFKCWFDQPLTEVSPLFEESFLADATPDDPDEVKLVCGGTNTIETGWAFIDSISVHLGGEKLDDDGALLGSISAGPDSVLDGGRLLWESTDLQFNGDFFDILEDD